MEVPSGASNSGAGYKRSRGTNWTEEETEQLLEAWGDREVQVLLESGPHNRQAFERVSFNLAEHQMDKTPSQCREKIKKLKTMYRNMHNHGKVPKNIRGRLMHKLHQVMEAIPAVCSAANIKDRDTDDTGNNEEMDGAGVERPTVNNVLGDDFASESSGMPANMNISISEQDFLDDDDSSASSNLESMSGSETDEFDIATETRAAKHRDRRREPTQKRKESCFKRHSAVYLLIDKVIAAQSAANERYAALEERRLLLDKELEEKRMEAEAARQEAQRQHELRLLSTMAQQMACVLKSINPLGFTGPRCEIIATPITVEDSTGDRSGGDTAVPSKPHEVNGCVHPNDYTDGSKYPDDYSEKQLSSYPQEAETIKR